MRALLITGFLGSGKTTFVLRSLIERYKHKKLGIVVNDFGEVSYDKISYYREGLRVMGVEGGCFCCETNAELLEALKHLKDTDLLIVETSGVSEPYPIMQALETSNFSSYLVVCVVSADSWKDFEKDPLFISQLSYSHCVVASRCDIALQEDVAQLEEYVKDKPIFLSYEGKVEEDFYTFLEGEKVEKISGTPSGIHAKERFSQTTLKVSGYYSMHEIEEYLRKLPKNIIRVKGFLRVIESPLPLGLNWTRNHTSWETIEKPIDSFLTFIGYGQLLLPPLPKAKNTDWEKMLPIGSFDKREHIAYLYGEVIDEIEAIEWLLIQDTKDATIITCEEDCPFDSKETIKVKPEFESFHFLIDKLGKSKLIILWKVPDAFASYLIKKLSNSNIIHIGTHYLLPEATLSLRVDTQEKEKVLKSLIMNSFSSSQAPSP